MTRLLRLDSDGPLRIIGLMSGTSADGVDAAVCEFTGCGHATAFELLGFTTVPYAPELQARILAAGTACAEELSALNFLLGEAFAQAAASGAEAAGLKLSECHAIGSHGQTVFHGVHADPARRHTLQIAAPAVIAERTGLPVVSDFRPRDIAAGGQGAPLMPYVDAVLFSVPNAIRWLLNIGGISNVTVIPANGQAVLGWDTGPGNVWIDTLITRQSNGRASFDRGGAVARGGRIMDNLLVELLMHPFLDEPPPKSTGAEAFGRDVVLSLYDRLGADAFADLVATVTAFTADAIAQSLDRFARPLGEPIDCLVSGGGAENPVLMERLARKIAPVRLRRTDELGVPSEAKEAMGFALLANDTLHGHPNSYPTVTGARHEVVLGSITL